MDGILIAFRLAKYDKNRASELVKRLYGQATSSHGGRYRYRRRGLLDDVPHRRLIRGVLILRAEDADRVAGKFVGLVAKELQEHGTIVEKYDVRRRESDVEAGIRYGYSANQVGFGWTNAVVLELLAQRERERARTVARRSRDPQTSQMTQHALR